MPSTTTNTVTIGTILDLIGPTTSSAGNGDGHSGFDSLLQATQPSPPLTPVDSRTSAVADSRPTDRNQQPAANETATNDKSMSDSNPDVSSQSSPPPTSAPVPANSDKGQASDKKPDRSNDKTDDQTATEQIIAQSLAGLPAASKPASEPVVVSTEVAATTEGTLSDTTKTNTAPAATSAMPAKAANQQSKVSATEGQAQANSETDNDSQKQNGKASSPVAAAVDEPTVKETVAKLQAGDKIEAKKDDKGQPATDDSQQTLEIQLTGDDKSQPQPAEAKHDQSQATDASQLTLDASANSTPSADGTNPQATTATPLVAPTTSAPPVVDQPGPAQSNNLNSTTGVTNVQSRPRLPAQALSPAANTATRHAPAEVDAARLISRVVRAFSAAQERDGEVRLRLSPPELGSLQLDIRVENGALTAHLQTETDTARLAIIDNLPTLRDRLADQGVRIERFDVDLMQRQPGGTPDQSGGRQPDTSETPVRFPPTTPPAGSPTPQSTASSLALTSNSTGGLNVII